MASSSDAGEGLDYRTPDAFVNRGNQDDGPEIGMLRSTSASILGLADHLDPGHRRLVVGRLDSEL
jgi:hypothetical protein